MGQWLTDSISQTSNKGTTSNSTTVDDQTETTERGARTTTVQNPNRVTTEATPSKTTTSEDTGDDNQIVTVTEDAGGALSFRIPVKSGLFATSAGPLCPTP